MEAHKAVPPPPLEAKKVRRKLKKVIGSALEKDPNARPQTAEALASSLRSRAEGIFGLLRRAGVIYTEYLQKFLGITVLLFLPFIIGSLLNVALGVYYIANNPVEGETSMGWRIAFTAVTIGTTFTGVFCGYLAVGTITWMVNQVLALPLRPVRIRPALRATWKNWKGLVGTGILATVLTFLGYALCIVPGIFLSITLALVAPVVMMENLRGFAAMKRSKTLVLRSLGTTTAAVALLFFIPLAIGGLTGGIVALSVKSLADAGEKIAAAGHNANTSNAEPGSQPVAAAPAVPANDDDDDVKIAVGPGGKVTVESDESTMIRRIARLARESITTLIMLPIQILLTSLSSIIVALLYLKTRQAGGENLHDLFIQFEETEHPRKKWQERVRQRLIQSGRVTSRS
jgi:hypothetical protein